MGSVSFRKGRIFKEGPTELDALTQYIQGHEEDIIVPCFK